MTDEQFEAIQDKIDDMARSARSSTKSTPEEIERILAVHAEWEDAYALPQRRWVDRQARDAALTAVARKHGLL